MRESSENGFVRWLDAMDLDLDGGAKHLGRTRRCVQLYLQGKQKPPLAVRYLMGALFEGWRPRPWPER